MVRNIVVVGKAGQGKSASIASLKRHNCNVQTTDEDMSEENSVKETKIIFSGQTYCLFGTPSFFDSD